MYIYKENGLLTQQNIYKDSNERWNVYKLLKNKCLSIDNPVNWIQCCGPLAVLIFPALLTNIQRPVWKSAQGPRGGDTVIETLPPLVFTLINKN